MTCPAPTGRTSGRQLRSSLRVLAGRRGTGMTDPAAEGALVNERWVMWQMRKQRRWAASLASAVARARARAAPARRRLAAKQAAIRRLSEFRRQLLARRELERS